MMRYSQEEKTHSTATWDQGWMALALKTPVSSQLNSAKLLYKETFLQQCLLFVLPNLHIQQHTVAVMEWVPYFCKWQPAVFQLRKFLCSLFINHLKADLMLT